MEGAKYLLDASVFIEAARRYYAFDFAPGFWNVLLSLFQDGRIGSIDRVQEELLRGDDDLAAWIRSDFSEAFFSTEDSSVIEVYRDVITWVQEQEQFSDAAKDKFARGADGWIVAYAKQNVYTVVTQEGLRPEAKKTVPIPNVCHAFNVNSVDTFKML